MLSMLWNVMYDGLSRMKPPGGVFIVEFADDAIIVELAHPQKY